MSRPDKPDYVVEYETIRKLGPPRCCHTCDHYSHDGRCLEFKLFVPHEFASLRDNCPVWELFLPF